MKDLTLIAIIILASVLLICLLCLVIYILNNDFVSSKIPKPPKYK
jgi:hypothetical protein